MQPPRAVSGPTALAQRDSVAQSSRRSARRGTRSDSRRSTRATSSTTAGRACSLCPTTTRHCCSATTSTPTASRASRRCTRSRRLRTSRSSSRSAASCARRRGMGTGRSGRRLRRCSAAARSTMRGLRSGSTPTPRRSKPRHALRPATRQSTMRSRLTGRAGLERNRRVRFDLRMTTTIREERKVLTAVFADVVGSTALAERLDPEDVKLVVGEAVARIVGEVESLGGHVKDLAGDGVLAFFGAPTTREDDAERAVRCALRIVGEMDEYAREVRRGWGAEGFGVRVGAATGAVVVGEVGAGSRVEYAAFGDTVNVAARLQSAAEPGTVLVDDATHRAVEGLFEWGSPQELHLKGKSQPVAAWPAVGVAAAGRTQRGLPGVETRLVGRSRELGLGREALEALRAGRGGVLVVAGDAGIGKTRLLNELRELAERDGSCWLEGRCVSYGESLPYWPFRDLLRGEWIGAGAEEPELRVRVGLRRRLEQLFGTLEASSAESTTPGGSSRSPSATGRGPQAGELYPYLGGLLEVALEHEAEARTSQLSPEALQWRTFEV